MDNKMLYTFAKNFVDEYEKCEEIKYDEEECDFYSSIDLEMYKAGLQAKIVDDFVKQLPSELQSKVILECMKIKTGGNFAF